MKGNPMGMLAICRKAGKLKAGFDPASDSLGRDAALIVFSSDASPKTIERMEFKAKRAGVKCVTLPFTSDEIDFAVGKRAVVLAITDKNLAGQISLMTDEHNKEVD
ncbi:MAG: hypothetical protein IKL92_07425 [Oscillospiraceae bacterium]|nr:hypothetical protein [Oscillospiraceae bacterium]